MNGLIHDDNVKIGINLNSLFDDTIDVCILKTVTNNDQIYVLLPQFHLKPGHHLKKWMLVGFLEFRISREYHHGIVSSSFLVLTDPSVINFFPIYRAMQFIKMERIP